MAYPHTPGAARARDTSIAAANDIRVRASAIRALVLEELLSSDLPLDTEQIAARIEEPYVSVQPRLSELSKKGLVEDSGVRHISAYNKKIIAWTPTAHARAMAKVMA